MKKAHAKGMGLFHWMSFAHDLILEKPVHDGRDERTTYAEPDLSFFEDQKTSRREAIIPVGPARNFIKAGTCRLFLLCILKA